ncbi:MAG TPA: response regulator [Stellaceae bacterium]|jgi:DNA-binding response OmpR family regulator
MPTFSISRLDALRVLIVDNSSMMRDLVRGVLESVGVRHFMTAGDGRSALDVLSAFGPHLAFVDWEMTPMNGLEFVRAVRGLSTFDNPFLPIIMLTSHAEEPWVIEAKNAGVHEYLIKPATGAAILARLSSVINNPRPFVRTDNYFGPARGNTAEDAIEIWR